jgi:hypothetical protein
MVLKMTKDVSKAKRLLSQFCMLGCNLMAELMFPLPSWEHWESWEGKLQRIIKGTVLHSNSSNSTTT